MRTYNKKEFIENQIELNILSINHYYNTLDNIINETIKNNIKQSIKKLQQKNMELVKRLNHD